MISTEGIYELLKTVVHPSDEKDIVNSGIVSTVDVSDSVIHIVLKFDKGNDPFKSSLQKAVERLLKREVDESVSIHVEVELPEKEEPANPFEKVKNIVAIASGKGGVGKSTVASNLAVILAEKGFRTALLDADIFGPSLPKMFGLMDVRPQVVTKEGKQVIIPVEKYGVKLLSLGFFLDPKDAAIWRGPMASNALRQLMNDADWGEIDYFLIDLPPGTSDIHLTVVQELSVTGAVIVSTPQEVAIADVVKGISMFKSQNVNVPVLGLVENMAWFTPAELPENKYFIFGEGGCAKLAEEYDIPLLGQVPLVQTIREGGDNGAPVVTLQKSIEKDFYISIADNLIAQIETRNTNLPKTEKVKVQK